MRKLSFTLVAATLLATGSLFANNLDGKPVKSLSSQISEMLSDNNLSELKTDLTAQVRFTLNDEGEIVVLSVDTDSETMEYLVKSKLNYHKVALSKVIEGKIYTVPVTIKA